MKEIGWLDARQLDMDQSSIETVVSRRVSIISMQGGEGRRRRERQLQGTIDDKNRIDQRPKNQTGLVKSMKVEKLNKNPACG